MCIQQYVYMCTSVCVFVSWCMSGVVLEFMYTTLVICMVIFDFTFMLMVDLMFSWTFIFMLIPICVPVFVFYTPF